MTAVAPLSKLRREKVARKPLGLVSFVESIFVSDQAHCAWLEVDDLRTLVYGIRRNSCRQRSADWIDQLGVYIGMD